MLGNNFYWDFSINFSNDMATVFTMSRSANISSTLGGSLAGIDGTQSLRRASSIRRTFTSSSAAAIKRKSVALQVKFAVVGISFSLCQFAISQIKESNFNLRLQNWLKQSNFLQEYTSVIFITSFSDFCTRCVENLVKFSATIS